MCFSIIVSMKTKEEANPPKKKPEKSKERKASGIGEKFHALVLKALEVLCIRVSHNLFHQN